MLEAGWEELGISDERASDIASSLVDEDTPFDALDFYKVRVGRGYILYIFSSTVHHAFCPRASYIAYVALGGWCILAVATQMLPVTRAY